MQQFQEQVDSGLRLKHAQVRQTADEFKQCAAAAARQLVRDLDAFTYEMPARYKAKFDAVETTSE
jgi:hypothetical protein